MSNRNTQNVEGMYLRRFCARVLRNWRMMLIVVLAGALLLGGYQMVKYAIAKPEPVMSQEELEEAMEDITANNEKIEEKQMAILTKQEDLVQLRARKASYEEALKKTLDVNAADAMFATDVLELNDRIIDGRKQIMDTIKAIDELNTGIAELGLANAELNASMEEMVIPRSVKNVVRGVILGALLGMLLVIAYAGLKWFSDKSLRNVDEMSIRYDIPVLGAMYTPATKQGKIDRWVDRFEGIPENANAAREYQMIAAKLELLCRDNRTILFTGTIEPEMLREVSEGVKACLTDGQHALLAAEDPMEHPETMRRIRDAELVLVEAAGISNRKEIDRLVKFLNLSKAAVVGAIVL